MVTSGEASVFKTQSPFQAEATTRIEIESTKAKPRKSQSSAEKSVSELPNPLVRRILDAQASIVCSSCVRNGLTRFRLYGTTYITDSREFVTTYITDSREFVFVCKVDHDHVSNGQLTGSVLTGECLLTCLHHRDEQCVNLGI